MTDPYALGKDGLAQLLPGDEPAYRAGQVHAWLARGVDDPRAMTDLPQGLRDRLTEVLDPPPRVLRHRVADDGLTHKVLLEGASGEPVESVLMLYPRTERSAARATVCISTQAGCAMGCPFCATGQAGLRGQLGVGEIVRQVTVMQRLLRTGEIASPPGDALKRRVPGDALKRRVPGDALKRRVPGDALKRRVPGHVTNVVFMGMGEPLANLGPTVDAVRWLHDPDGFNLSARSITVSTVGLVPGIRRLAELGLPLTLAVSLHAPNDALRDDLVPVNRQHPLGELLAACRDYLATTGRRLTFEYILIDGVNDRLDHARELALLVRDLLCHVNLIPMNPTPGVGWTAPSAGHQQAFTRVLADHGLAVTLRRNRGTDIEAACGQLYADYALGSGKILPVARGAAERIAP